VLKRVGRWDTTLAFLGSYALLEALRNLWLGWAWDVWAHRLMSGSLLLFALFMVTDPRSIPNARPAQGAVGRGHRRVDLCVTQPVLSLDGGILGAVGHELYHAVARPLVCGPALHLETSDRVGARAKPCPSGGFVLEHQFRVHYLVPRLCVGTHHGGSACRHERQSHTTEISWLCQGTSSNWFLNAVMLQ
jgi:hypothetical protein